MRARKARGFARGTSDSGRAKQNDASRTTWVASLVARIAVNRGSSHKFRDCRRNRAAARRSCRAWNANPLPQRKTSHGGADGLYSADDSWPERRAKPDAEARRRRHADRFGRRRRRELAGADHSDRALAARAPAITSGVPAAASVIARILRRLRLSSSLYESSAIQAPRQRETSSSVHSICAYSPEPF